MIALGLLAALAHPARPAGAQTLTTGVLTGVVRDQTGGLLADVELTITDQDGGASRTYLTTRDGAFRFPLLPPGSYTLRVERLGYRPKLIEAVPLRPGERLELEVRLAAAPPPVDAPEVERFEGSGSGSRAGVGQWLSSLRLAGLPWDRMDLAEVAGLSTASTDGLEVEGLPASLSTLVVDGVPYPSIRHPDIDRDPGILALPLGVFESAELVTADPDMQWNGFAGGALSAHSRRGASEFAARGFASASGGPLRGSRFIDGSNPSNVSLWGGLLLNGPIIPDTAHFAIGFEARRMETPRPSPWSPETSSTALLEAGQNGHSVGLDAYTRPFVLQTTVASAFGRFDWQLGNDNTLSVRAGLGSIMAPGGDTDLARAAVPGAVAEGSDVLLSAALSSTFSGDWAYEIRAGVTRGTREYVEGTGSLGGTPLLPSTFVTDGGFHFGADPRLPGSFQRTGFTTAQSLEMSAGRHRVKVGIDTEIAAHDDSYVYGRRAEFFFGGASQFANGQGAFVQTLTPSPRASYTRLGLGAYLQDTWNAGPGLRVVAGVRWDVETLPVEDIRLSQRWLDYTGLANNDVPERVWTLSPRLGVTWDVGGEGLWTVRATAGAYALPIPSEVISEIITMDGTPGVRRIVGEVDAWPSLPAEAPLSAPSRLSLLGPEFRGPLTGRASFGVSRLVGPGTTLHFSGSYRETEFLTRRSDLNRFSTASATDQHGRRVYGPLVKSGELVASPRPNRRFSDFDVVSALNADGWSRYWGVTAALEHDSGGPLALFARYTYSNTTDNWLARAEGGPDAQLSPIPEGGATDWREGTSDFDLPHRIAAGAEFRFSGGSGPRLSAVYRYRSGYPFTPGFRTGVDVNGDGSGRNDPAFVDQAVAGLDALMRDWNCLQSQSGRLAQRNSCREAGAHGLDVRFGLNLSGSTGLSAEVFAEALNVIEPPIGEVDAALYRIDPSRSLVEDAARGQLTIPLIANPDFGTRLTRIGSGRTLRIGVEVMF